MPLGPVNIPQICFDCSEKVCFRSSLIKQAEERSLAGLGWGLPLTAYFRESR